MKNYFNIGIGSFFTILGLYILSKFNSDIVSVIGGIFCIALGLGIIASTK